MEMALRRRLAGVAEISISQREQTAAVTFVPGTLVFSTEAFRSAIAEAEVEVLNLDVRVCGFVDEDGRLYSTVSRHGPLVQLRGDVSPGSSICVGGRLDDRAHPYELSVASAEPRS